MKKILAILMTLVVVFSIFPMFVTHAGAGTWVTKAPLPQPLDTFGVAVANGRIYAVGGLNACDPYRWTNTNYEYNPAIDSWSSKAFMPTKRGTLAVASVNNKIYAIGGAANVSGNTLSTNEEFDPTSNSWTVKAPMPTNRNWISAAVVKGKIYVIAGSNNQGGKYTVNEVYDPLTDTWTTKKPCPHGRLAYGIGVVNDKIYVIGGRPADQATLNEEYDPETDIWTTKAPMPTGRNGLAIAVVNNKIYAIGGATDFNPWTNNLDVVEEYDPSTDTWRTVESMSTPRSLLSTASIGNKIYAIGGWGSAGFLDLNEEFQTIPVGGVWIPVDKLSLLSPYIALVSTIILAISISVAYIKIRKKQ